MLQQLPKSISKAISDISANESVLTNNSLLQKCLVKDNEKCNVFLKYIPTQHQDKNIQQGSKGNGRQYNSIHHFSQSENKYRKVIPQTSFSNST